MNLVFLILRFLTLFIFASYLLGCGPSYYYKYTPPQTSEGVSCVRTCSDERRSCRQLQQVQDQNTRNLFEAKARTYDACRVGRSDKDARKYCSSPNFSFPLESLSQNSCEDDFNQCYQTCGGTVDRILESR